MAKCSNCGAAMSCGCQRRTTSTGKVGCTKCISALTKAELLNKEKKK
jgi:hypothetical protein